MIQMIEIVDDIGITNNTFNYTNFMVMAGTMVGFLTTIYLMVM